MLEIVADYVIPLIATVGLVSIVMFMFNESLLLKEQTEMPETVTKAHALKWSYDGSGEWTAVSQVMDEDMTDEPIERWCHEWCHQWVITVDEEGLFSCGTSDKYLINGWESIRGAWDSLSKLQAAIDIVEMNHREQDGVVLLPAEVFNKGQSSAEQQDTASAD